MFENKQGKRYLQAIQHVFNAYWIVFLALYFLEFSSYNK